MNLTKTHRGESADSRNLFNGAIAAAVFVRRRITGATEILSSFPAMVDGTNAPCEIVNAQIADGYSGVYSLSARNTVLILTGRFAGNHRNLVSRFLLGMMMPLSCLANLSREAGYAMKANDALLPRTNAKKAYHGGS